MTVYILQEWHNSFPEQWNIIGVFKSRESALSSKEAFKHTDWHSPRESDYSLSLHEVSL